MTKDIELCGATPLGGDGSLTCDRPAIHKGLHEGEGVPFRKIEPGSSARSKRQKEAAHIRARRGPT